VLRKSGEIPWAKKSFAVSAGINQFEWVYKKDNSVTQGSDCAWIDLIDFAQTSPVNYIQKDLQLAKIVAPTISDHYGQETISVKVLNLGKEIMNGFNLAYVINNHFPPVKQHFDNQVAPFGDSVLVSFSTKADLSKYGIYNIVAYGVDNNDDYKLNDTMSVNIENTEIIETVGVFPNPFTDRLTIHINSPVPEKIQISITNVSGKKLYQIEKEILRGSNSITISDLRLIPSLYYLNIKGSIINKTIPVIKLNR
jgi:hypothetical protein